MNTNEYMMLRDEILHLNERINNTINFFYVFVSAVLAFGINQEESIFVLLTYMVIIPSYMIVLNKRNSVYKIAAYLYVFHEGKEFNWERRQKKLYQKLNAQTGRRASVSQYPFLIVSTFVTIVFAIKTNWNSICVVSEFLKVLFGISLYIIQIVLVFRNKGGHIDKYIPYWKEVKEDEYLKRVNKKHK